MAGGSDLRVVRRAPPVRERHTQGYALALLGGALTWNPGCPLQPALLPEAAGSEEGGVNQACYPWVNQRADPAPARGPPPRRPRGGLLPPSRGSGEGARPRRRRWRRLRLGWLPPRGREAAVSLAPRHPPPPAANPHPGWGEGDANYPGSGSARPPPPRPSPACTRPRIPGLACAARPLGPPPSPGSAGWVTPPGAGGRGEGGWGRLHNQAGRGPGAGRGPARGPRSRKPGTATGPRRGEPGFRPRPQAASARPRAAPRDRPAPIGSPARRSPPLLRTAPTRGPRRAAGARHPGTCSPSRLPPASRKRRGDYDVQKSPRPLPPTGTLHPFPLLCKAPLPVFSAPSPPSPMELNPGQLQRMHAAPNRPPGGREHPQYLAANLARDAPPYLPTPVSPTLNAAPLPLPRSPRAWDPRKAMHSRGGGPLGHKSMHLAPNSPSRAATPPRARDPGCLQPRGSCQPPPPLKLAERPRLRDLPFPGGQRWAQRPRPVPALHPVRGVAPGADLPRAAGPGPGRAGARGAGARSWDWAPRPLASGVRVSRSPPLALSPRRSLAPAAAAASLPLQVKPPPARAAPRSSGFTGTRSGPELTFNQQPRVVKPGPVQAALLGTPSARDPRRPSEPGPMRVPLLGPGAPSVTTTDVPDMALRPQPRRGCRGIRLGLARRATTLPGLQACALRKGGAGPHRAGSPSTPTPRSGDTKTTSSYRTSKEPCPLAEEPPPSGPPAESPACAGDGSGEEAREALV
ncbi:basic proline-rich protein-like [Mustela lutreola]|uniref:basic proline-rich protein-like n=1 Tax=Mustela lutreola TaxID=9666 RepID=UPI0027972ACA|nr:basic proline-rich protein-like [Mustela lutreola]